MIATLVPQTEGAARGIRTPVGRPIGLAIRRNGQAMRSPQAFGPLCYLK